MIASPAFRSTARSGNIAPRHLSQIVMVALYHARKWKHIHRKYWSTGEMALPDAYQARPLERSEVEESLLVNQLEQPMESLTGVLLSHRIVASRRAPHYV